MKTFVATDTNDLALVTVGHKKRLSLETDQVVVGAAKLFRRFQFFEGEWFLDKRLGVPYLKFVFVKNPDFAVVRRLIRQIILSTDVIATMNKLEFGYEPTTRKLSFYFEATASDGRRVTGSATRPFIVDGRSIGLAQGSITQ